MFCCTFLTFTGCNISLGGQVVDCITKSDKQVTECTVDKKELLQSVLENKKTFTSRDGAVVYLKNYPRYDGTNDTKTIKYAYVDFDGDGQLELILMMASDISGGFLVLHCNEDRVYGYDFHWEGMLALKQDGSFIQHKVDEELYCRLKFKDNKCLIVNEAVKFYENKYEEQAFELNGKEVAEDVFNEFAYNWASKENVIWKNVRT